MQKLWIWLRNNGLAITALTGIGALFIAAGNVLFLNPIHHRLDDLGTHIDQRFDDQNRAIDQRFDDQDKAINQRFDAQNKSVNQRFDDQTKYIDQRFDDQTRYIDQRIDNLEAGMNQGFDDQNKSIRRLTGEVAELRKLTVSIGERVSRNEGRIDAIMQQLQTADAPAP